MLFWGLTWWLDRDSSSGHLRVNELKRERNTHSLSSLCLRKGKGTNLISLPWWVTGGVSV